MANLTIHSNIPQTQLFPQVAKPAAQTAPAASPLVTQTSLDKVSLSAQAKATKGLNLREAVVGAGITLIPAGALALMTDNRAAGIGYGLGLSAGVGLAYVNLGDGFANKAKNVVAGAVIGGSLAGTASSQPLFKILLGEKAKYAVAAGAVAGAGLAIYKEVTR